MKQHGCNKCKLTNINSQILLVFRSSQIFPFSGWTSLLTGFEEKVRQWLLLKTLDCNEDFGAYFSRTRSRFRNRIFRGRGRDEARNFASFLGHFEVETRPSRTSVVYEVTTCGSWKTVWKFDPTFKLVLTQFQPFSQSLTFGDVLPLCPFQIPINKI